MRESSSRMTEGSIAWKIISFALPLFLGNLFQQLYNVADTLIVGNLIGNTALAAVSSTGSLVFLLVGFFNGIAIGEGVVISRRFGAKDIPAMQTAIHTALAFGITAGILMTVVGVLLSPQILIWMDTPDEVMDLSVEYIRIYFAGGLGMVLYNTCTGIMQAVGDSRHPLMYLIISSVLNVILDIVMISVFHLGVGGAALATIISQFISVILCLTRLMRVKEAYRVSLRKIRFDWPTLKQILHNGLPSGLQNSIISFANVVVQANVNSFGEMAIAGTGAYTKIEGFAFLPITSFTMALTTFVSQNLGAKEYERAKKGSRFGLICAMGMSELIGAVIYITVPVLLRAFTDEPLSIEYGMNRARICALFYCLMAFSHGVAAVLRGAGRSVIPMITMLIFWCVVRVGFLTIFVPMTGSFSTISWVYPLTWSLSTVTFLIYYLKADWVHGYQTASSSKGK